MGRFDLVTFSFGGDDIGFESIITHCFTTGCPPDSAVRRKIHLLGTTGVYKGRLHIPSYPTFLKHVAETAVVHGGNVVVMGYPEVIEDPTLWPAALRKLGMCQGVTADQARLMRGWAGDLNATIGHSVSEVNALPTEQRNGVHFTFIDIVSGGNGISRSTSNLFEPATGTRHELCSDGDQAWLNGVSPLHLLTRSFHPTQTGTNAMGQLAATVLAPIERSTSGQWTSPSLIITPHSLGSVTIGMTVDQAQAAAGIEFNGAGDGFSYSTMLGTDYPHDYIGGTPAFCVGASAPYSGTSAQTVSTPEGFELGQSVSTLLRIYGSQAHYVSAPTGGGMTDNAGYVVADDGGEFSFVVTPSGDIDNISSGPNVTPNSCTG